MRFVFALTERQSGRYLIYSPLEVRAKVKLSTVRRIKKNTPTNIFYRGEWYYI